jgi:hypothetical protein
MPKSFILSLKILTQVIAKNFTVQKYNYMKMMRKLDKNKIRKVNEVDG